MELIQLGAPARRRWLVGLLGIVVLIAVLPELSGPQLPSVTRSISTTDDVGRIPASIAGEPPYRQGPNVERNQEHPLPPPPPQRAKFKRVKKQPPQTYPPSAFANCTLLRPEDYIYQYGPWDGAPIVLRRHRLLLFTVPKVGCTVWKQLCRRAAGYDDWRDDRHPLPHAPRRNGLEYLYDFEPQEADHMLTDPAWTRAIFVRDPLERLLSAYLDKVARHQYMQFHCCRALRSESQNDTNVAMPSKRVYEMLKCSNPQLDKGPAYQNQAPSPTFQDFLYLIAHHPSPDCRLDPHWLPISQRLEAKYWPLINFVGNMNTMAEDAKRLLDRVGAWHNYGAWGWPPANGTIFEGPAADYHATGAGNKMSQYYGLRAVGGRYALQNGANAPSRPALEMAMELSRNDYDTVPGLVMPNLSTVNF